MARKHSRRLAMERYEKQRRRNLLAEPGPQALVIVLDRLKAGFNVAKIFRSAQAFGVRELHLIGIGPFDPAPAKGAFKVVPAHHHEQFADCHRQLTEQGYQCFILAPGCANTLYHAELPEKSAFIFGHEEYGISFDPAHYPDIQCIGIPQFGPLQSLNVSVAASIVMYEYTRRAEHTLRAPG